MVNIEITNVECVKWTIPSFGSRRNCPYGVLRITYNSNGKSCMLHKEMKEDEEGKQYITLERCRYRAITIGSLFNPKRIELKKMQKKVVHRKTYWLD